MCGKVAEGVGDRPELGVSVTFPGPEPVPAAFQPMLECDTCDTWTHHTGVKLSAQTPEPSLGTSIILPSTLVWL